jgi:hypothetical protein
MNKTFRNIAKTAFASIILGVAASAHAGPILYIDDVAGNLGTVDVQTGEAKVIGFTGRSLVDIAFSSNGDLYGITFSQLFKLDKTNGKSTLVGNLGTSLNSLVFSKDGTLYGASNGLYTINVNTGAATAVSNGNSGYGFSSSGDLAFVGSQLYLSSTPGDSLVQIDTATGIGSLVGNIGYSGVFGLASDNNVNLYGVTGTTVIKINPLTGTSTALVNYGGQGLFGANGTAFIAEAVVQEPNVPSDVPEPATALLLGLGSLGAYVSRRRSKK